MSSETVIREVAKGVWTFSRPFARFGLIPIGGRSTAIKLKDGGVWVLASTPLDEETKNTIDNLGPVKFIVSPDAVHYLFLGEFKKAYPSAKLIAPQEAIERSSDKSLVYDGVWGRDPPGTKYEFEDDVKHCYFSGFKNKDVAFFHGESKSLIEADLLLNLPCNEQYSKSTTPPTLLGWIGVGPHSWLHPRLTWKLGVDKEAMQRDTKTVCSWDFDRIIPCHGDVIETDGKDAWRAAFRFYLD
ncbi:hypothetical protein K443DRAFT_677227 [Laccaria amethystina LaAM-08-1]|uniref:DUF4336 domain-containing protein n=1 Tax=Laccaria amethystina LaAM-08-1 TaxID=1095629 RepID=A0A0C9XMZ6_9AGAR|nr:hypothetical protein K443DRAFT_677227 [Laccaria amethystina LaAM-08-1]